MKPLLVIALLVASIEAAKILIHDFKFQRSHVQFLNTIADILADEGHEVVMLSNVLDASLRDEGTKRVRRYFTEQTPEAARLRASRMGQNNWKSRGFYDWFKNFGVRKFLSAMAGQCESLLQDEKLFKQLREEKFDVALTSPVDYCAYYVFYKAGITNYAVIDLHSTLVNGMRMTGVPEQLSTLPGRFASFSEMTFSNRLKNFITDGSMKMVPKLIKIDFWERIEAVFENAPDFSELVANTSMVFINRIPTIDFPSLTTHTIVDIGGLTISKTNKILDEHWDSILSLRPRTILISFGTISLSSDMPESYRNSLIQAIKSFPDITFVWKYEKPEDRISDGVDNLIEATFTPQKAILQDPRLSLFITHCGWSSTLETMMAGVPVIAIPTSTDQHRNAQVLKRGGGGIVMNKKDLENSEVIERNIREILENESYRTSAHRIASVIKNSPYSGRENFLRNLDFLIKFGPLPSMRIPSHKQSFIEYHMIDVYALVTVVLLVLAYSVFTILKFMLKTVLSIALRKVKTD